MPYGDKTGPDGKGPQTGRKMGVCAGNSEAPVPAFGRPRGCFRRMRRFGRHGRMPFQETPQDVNLSPQEQTKVLENHKKALNAEVQAVEKQLKDLKTK